MGARLLKIFSIIIAGSGIIWLNAKPLGNAVAWVADYFSLNDHLQTINKPLQAFYERVLVMDQSALIVQYGPWVLTIGGALLLVWIIIWQYLRGLFKQYLSEKLAQACENLAEEIRQFIRQQQLQEPQHLADDLTHETDEDLDRRIAEEADYLSQKKVLYEERINPKLNDLHLMLVKNKHRPNEIMTFGDQSWANRNIGKLTSYARIIRQGEKIIDDRGGQIEPPP